ncbi:hypothetical protein [Thermicanus aegyptius]|uniref:hypothetical protein n=1 Tax=Thermicanus aegyptius TaxID=94009 RepID=UPI000427DC8E|nr:hypothetical protein [Thermicanus aegyptius]
MEGYDKTIVLEGKENVVYDYKVTVFFICPDTGKQREMVHGGFKKDRNSIKKLCPAKQMDIEFKVQAQCAVAQGIWISLAEDRRIFTLIVRTSCKWEKEYAKRTAVEHVNGWLGVFWIRAFASKHGQNEDANRACAMRDAGDGPGKNQGERSPEHA